MFIDTTNLDIVGDSVKRGLLYVVINSICANIWKWSACYYLIEPDEDDDEEDKNKFLLNDNEETNNQIIIKKPKYKEKTFKDIIKSQ